MKRLLIGAGALLVLLAAAAGYFLYAPTPQWPNKGLQRLTLEVQGHQRSYTVFLPPHVAPGARVLLALHPSLASGDMMRAQVGGSLERLALRDGAIIVYPDGHEGHFNDCRSAATYSARLKQIDDVGFMRRIVERLVAEHGADPRRVDALGYSNGGHMALRLALEASDLVRGVVAIAANQPASNNQGCDTGSTAIRRVVLIQGTRDPVNPYQGGVVSFLGLGSRGAVLSAQASADWWAQRLALAPASDKRVAESAGISVRQQDWASTTARVRLVSLEGAGHTVPQSDYRYPRLMGATLQNDEILTATWQLLDHH